MSEGENAKWAGGPFITAETTATEAICQVLEQAGIEQVFGLPGGDVMKLFDALRDHHRSIRTVLVREESLASIMAEAYGRYTGKPAAVVTQGAWLLAHGAGGALEALNGASPVVYLTDLSDKIPFSHHSPTQTGTGHYGSWDSHLALRGFMKEVMEAHDPIQAVQMTQLAIKHATTGCPGPVAVVYYSGALKGSVGPKSSPSLQPTSGYLLADGRGIDGAACAQAAQWLAQARRPVILAGNGVRLARASASLTALAEALSAPVLTTSSGKGVFSETHALAAGVVGDYGLDAAAQLMGEADVVLAVGTRLAPGDTIKQHPGLLDVRRQTLIQIDIEPRNVGWTHAVHCGLIGDADVALRALRQALEGRAGHADSGETQMRRRETGQERVKRAAEAGFFDNAESLSDAVPILPQRLIRELREALPPETVVTADAGENRIFMVHHYRTRTPGGFLQPGSMGGMGYAIPAALGVKLAAPDTPVVAVCGDGGFGMSMNGLMTALEAKLPITVVIMNNGMLGWVAHVQGERRIASDLGRYDYAAIARAMGCRATRVEQPSQLRGALQEAVASGQTSVVEVLTSGVPSWEDVCCHVRGTGPLL